MCTCEETNRNWTDAVSAPHWHGFFSSMRKVTGRKEKWCHTCKRKDNKEMANDEGNLCRSFPGPRAPPAVMEMQLWCHNRGPSRWPGFSALLCLVSQEQKQKLQQWTGRILLLTYRCALSPAQLLCIGPRHDPARLIVW